MKRTKRELAAGSSHPDPGTLLDLVEGRLEDAGSTAVRAHLDRCGPCRKRLAALEDLKAAIPGRHLETTPDWLAAWGDDVPRLHPRPGRKPRESILSLVFDSRLALPAAVRAASPTARRLVYRAGSHDLDMEIETLATGVVRIQGQVLDGSSRGDYAGGVVRILSGKRVVARAPLDPDGRFRLEKVACRRACSLAVEAPGFLLELPDLDL